MLPTATSAGVAAAALVAVAGCSSHSQRTIAPTASPVAPPSTVRSKPLFRAQAAKRYLEVVRPYNPALERLEQPFNAGEPVVTLRALADGVARSNAAHMRKLHATVWPSAVRVPMKELLAESAVAQR